MEGVNEGETTLLPLTPPGLSLHPHSPPLSPLTPRDAHSLGIRGALTLKFA